jgi:hypothetical protein
MAGRRKDGVTSHAEMRSRASLRRFTASSGEGEEQSPLSPRHCERSEAIHSFFMPQDGLLRFARNDGGATVRILAAHRARSFAFRLSLPLTTEGAGKTGCALHPRSRVQSAQKETHTSIQVQRKHSGLPCAVALRLTSCSPRSTAFLPPSPLRSFASQKLDASTAASGPHDFAVRIMRIRLARTPRPPHLTARS